MKKISMLVVVCMMFTLLTAIPAFAENFSDGFEDATLSSSWTASGTPTYALSSEQKNGGSQSLKLTSAANKWLQWTATSPSKSSVIVYFYDYDVTGATGGISGIQVESSSPTNGSVFLGIRLPVTTGLNANYTIKDYGNNITPLWGWKDSTKARTVGWHKFEIKSVTGNNVQLLIDDVAVHTSTSGAFSDIKTVKIGAPMNVSSTRVSYFDDLTVTSLASPTSRVTIDTCPTSMTVGDDDATIALTLTPSDAATASYVISDKTVMNLVNGKLRALKAGTATIIANSGGVYSETKTVTVNAAPLPFVMFDSENATASPYNAYSSANIAGTGDWGGKFGTVTYNYGYSDTVATGTNVYKHSWTNVTTARNSYAYTDSSDTASPINMGYYVLKSKSNLVFKVNVYLPEGLTGTSITFSYGGGTGTATQSLLSYTPGWYEVTIPSSKATGDQLACNLLGVSGTGYILIDDIRIVDGTGTETTGFTLLKASYGVTFDSMGGSAVVGKTANDGEKITTPTAPTKDGYTFGGWYKESGCTTEWDFAIDVVTGATTIYAKWTENVVKYAVTYDANGATSGSVPTDSTQYVANSTVTVAGNTGSLVKTGYTFAGWKTASDESGTDYTAGTGTFAITGNTTLFAKWTEDYTYSVGQDATALTTEFASAGTDGVTGNVTLPSTGSVKDSGITWSSNSINVDATTGNIIRPSFADGDKDVTLTARVAKNGQFTTQNVTVKVKKMDAVAEKAFNKFVPTNLSINFNGAYDSAVDASGNIYVTDYYNHRVVKFNAAGNFVCSYGTKGNGVGQFNYPAGIVIHSSGLVVVADSYNHRIVFFQDSNNNGTIESNEWAALGTMGTGGTVGGTDIQFRIPTGVYIADKYLYVADTYNNRIVVIDGNENKIAKIVGSKGTANNQFNMPYDVVADVSGNMWVADNLNNKVKRFDSAGAFVIGYDCADPKGLAIDANENVFVSQRTLGNVKCVNNTKVDLASVFGTKTTSSSFEAGKFKNPMGLNVDASGRLWIVDVTAGKVQTAN